MGNERKIIGSNSGAEYIIDKEIGRGGQGRVFSIKGGKYAFKLIGKKTGRKSQLLKRKIAYLKTRPIEDLPISKPLEQVDGEALGYIMEMATDMVSLDHYIKPDNEFVQWWKNTGGVYKRISLLKKISKTIAELHARGLVYGDFSLKNIFVSKDKGYDEVFFIDSDNITHDSKVGTAVYTPGYAAPEIIQTDTTVATSGYDTFTDNYSFAIIAYQMLTLNHPFIGDYVNDGEPELEEEAYLGKIPWVNHRSDKRNIASSGIPSSMTISKKMHQAFRKTFEEGVDNKFERTTAANWVEIFSGVLDNLIECQSRTCQNHFLFKKDLICPFCGAEMNSVGKVWIIPLVKKMIDDIKLNNTVKLNNISSLGKAISQKIMTPNKYLILRESDFFLNSSNKELFKIRYNEDSIYISGIGQRSISISSNNKHKKSVDISNEIKATLEGDFYLYNDVKEYQRILKFKKYRV